MLKNKKLYDIAFLLLIALISFTWFRGDFIINYGDQGLPLSPLFDFKAYFYSAWGELRGTGYPTGGLITSFLYYSFPLLTILGFSLSLAEKLLYFFVFALGGISVYLLAASLKGKNDRLISLTAALAYMFSFYPILTFWTSFIGVAFYYACAPLLLLNFIKILKTGRHRHFIYWLLVATLIFSTAAANPGHILTLFIIHFLYFLYYVWQKANKQETAKALLRSLILAISWLFFNAWWLLPHIYNIGSTLTLTGANQSAGSEEVMQGVSIFTGFLNLFRFLGPWPFWAQIAGEAYFPWAKIYHNPLFLILSFIGPVLVFLALLKKKKNSNLLYFALLFLLGLFMMKGVFPPFENLNKFIVLKIPFLVVFRNSYDKFGVMTLLSYAVLLGFGFKYLYLLLKKFLKNKEKSYIIVGILAFFLFFVYMWPYFTGDLIYKGGEINPGARVKIPDYYYQASGWLEKQPEEFRIISLPHQEGAAYDWEYGYMGNDDPATHLLKRPIILTFDPKDDILNPYFSYLLDVYYKPYGNQQNAQLNFAAMTNTGYIMLHNDLRYEFNTPNPSIKSSDIKKTLDSNEEIKLVKSFGKLDLYKIDDDYFLPRFYTSESIISLDGGVGDLAKVLNLKDFNFKSSIFYKDRNELDASKLSNTEFIAAKGFNYASLAQKIGVEVPARPFLNKKIIDLKKKNPQTSQVGENNENILPGNVNKQEFELNLDEEGKYDLLLSEQESVQKMQGWKLILDKKTLDKNKMKKREGNWFEWPNISLSEGRHSLSLEFDNIDNLLKHDWEKINLDDSSGKRHSVWLKKIDSCQANVLYRLSGTSKLGKRNINLAVGSSDKEINQGNKDANIRILEGGKLYLPQEGNFEHYLWPEKSSKFVYLALFGVNDIKKEQVFENLNLQRVFQPEILFKKTKEKKLFSPEISFTRINPTKYKIKVNNANKPYLLNFSESYHKDWQIYLLENDRQIKLDGIEHSLVNGFANAWYIEPNDVKNKPSYELVIKFWPQSLMYMGAIISGISLIMGTLFLLILKIKK